MDAPTALSSLLASGDLVELLSSVQSAKYLCVACFGLLVYDYLLTMDEEVSIAMVIRCALKEVNWTPRLP